MRISHFSLNEMNEKIVGRLCLTDIDFRHGGSGNDVDDEYW